MSLQVRRTIAVERKETQGCWSRMISALVLAYQPVLFAAVHCIVHTTCTFGGGA